MCKPPLFLLLVAVLAPLCAQTPSRPLTDLACVEDLSIPEYSGALRVGWIARVTGSARVLITVSSNGTPSSIDVQSPSSFLKAVLERSFAHARFSTRCAGQVLEINFIYELRGGPQHSPRQSIRVKNANTFEIIATPSPTISPQP